MKTLLITILALVSIQLNAQNWVQVPDAIFQVYITNHYSPQAHMTIGSDYYVDSDHADIQAADSLNFNYSGITNLEGIQAFENLWYLSCRTSGLTNLPNSLPPLIRYLNVLENQLTSLPAVLPPALKYLYCDHNQLTSIPDLPSNLRRLVCTYNAITTLPVLPSLLNELSCGFNQLTIIPDLPPSLLVLQCTDNQLTSLPDLPDSLMQLLCNYNQLTSLPQLPTYQLQVVWCDSNQLTSLPALPVTLKQLICNSNQLTELVNMPELEILQCGNNPITCFGEFPSTLQSLGIGSGPFTCVPNHVEAMSSSFKLTHPLCEDNDAVHNPYNCPAAAAIHGHTFYDSISTCTDYGSFSHVPMLLLDSAGNLLVTATSFEDGEYYFLANPGTYELKVDTSLLSQSIELTCPQSNSSNATISTASSVVSGGDFGFNCAGFDLGVQSVVPNGLVFPGQWHHLKVKAGDLSALYAAHCASGVSGQVTIAVTGPGVVSFNGNPISVSGATAVYNVADFGTAGANEFTMDIVTDTTAGLADQYCVDISVATSASGEIDPSNNSYNYCYDVSNSYDPNIKETYPEIVEPGYQDEFTYTIHFQNTGNAPAINIQLSDRLDNNLDLSTFKPVDASAVFTTTLNTTTRILTVRFPNIMLPDSASDPQGSIGFIQYRVKPLPGLTNGTIIHNTAYIYFDYNAPIVTNTTENVFFTDLGLGEWNAETIQLYPNPAENEFLVRAESEIDQITLSDINGKQVVVDLPHAKTTSVDVSDLKQGIYLVTIKTNQSVITKRLIVR